MGTPEFYYTLGAGLQIAGVMVIAFGVLKVREQLDPHRSSLAAARHQAVVVAAGLRFAWQWLLRVWRRALQHVRRLVYRLRGVDFRKRAAAVSLTFRQALAGRDMPV